MRSVIVAGVAGIALTLGGCGMFGSGSDTSTSAGDRASTRVNITDDNASRGGGSTAMPSSSTPSSTSAASIAENAPSGNGAGLADVMEAQQDLRSAGLYKGKIDGIAGPETTQAVKNFQQKNELPQTGMLDQATMLQLRTATRSACSRAFDTSEQATADSWDMLELGTELSATARFFCAKASPPIHLRFRLAA
jgi:peptidoglycan hydrolase-like protein with peptidoglycan-binding domain